jgi:small ligand-binding sensory domain FIST
VQAGGALVLTADPGEAARRAAGQARAALGGLAPSFAVLFASPHFLASAPALVEAVAGETGGVPLIGCVAAAVAGGAREVENEPAVSLWLAADLGPVETFGMEFVPTCTGRGARMFSAPDHDAGLVAEILGGIPVAGFFCDGELGPVGGRNFLHTFTASLALFPGAPSG